MTVSEQAIRERFRSQLLAGGQASTPLGAVERLLAIQAQDLRGFRLAVRCAAETVSALDAALAERELVVSWLVLLALGSEMSANDDRQQRRP